jgi:hypothetical protein
MSEQTLTLADDSGGIVEFGSFRNPELALREMEQVAAAFQKRANTLGLYKKIGDSKHLLIEGWQMLAAMYRVTASVRETKYVAFGDVNGWEATAIAIHVPSGREISSADGMCLSDEDNWGPRTKYEWFDKPDGGRGKRAMGTVPTPTQQLRSMAQTRACSKVLSNLLKPVARMAGFAGTPGEEMTGDEGSGDRPPVSQPGRKSEAGLVISEAQAKRLWALAKSASKGEDHIRAVLKHFGFESSKDVTRDKYDSVCAAVQKDLPAQAQSQPNPSDQPPADLKDHPDWPEVLSGDQWFKVKGVVHRISPKTGNYQPWPFKE